MKSGQHETSETSTNPTEELPPPPYYNEGETGVNNPVEKEGQKTDDTTSFLKKMMKGIALHKAPNAEPPPYVTPSIYQAIEESKDDDEDTTCKILNNVISENPNIGHRAIKKEHDKMSPLQFAVLHANRWAVKELLKKDLYKGDPELHYETKEHGPALQLAVSYRDDDEKPDPLTIKRHAIIDLLMEQEPALKISDSFSEKEVKPCSKKEAKYLFNVIESACKNHNIYFLERLILKNIKLLTDKIIATNDKILNIKLEILQIGLEESKRCVEEVNKIMPIIVETITASKKPQLLVSLLKTHESYISSDGFDLYPPSMPKLNFPTAYGNVIERCLKEKDFDLLNTFLAAHKIDYIVNRKIREEFSELFGNLIYASYVSKVMNYLRDNTHIDTKKAFSSVKLLIIHGAPIESNDLIYLWKLDQLDQKEKQDTFHQCIKHGITGSYGRGTGLHINSDLKELYSPILSFNDPKLIMNFCYELGRYNRDRCEDFREWLCYMMKLAITSGNIDQLKCLFYVSENKDQGVPLTPKVGGNHVDSNCDQEGSKRITDYLTLGNYVTSYDKYEPDEESLEKAKTLVTRMNRDDAQHLLDCYTQNKSKESHQIIAKLLLTHLKNNVHSVISTKDQGSLDEKPDETGSTLRVRM